MRRAIKIIAVLVLLSFVIAITYRHWVLLSSYLPHALFYGYVSMGMIVSIFVILFSVKNTSGSLRNIDESNVALLPAFVQMNSSKLKKFRLRAGLILEGVSAGLTFPAFVIYTASKVKYISSDNQRGQFLKAISYDIINGPQMTNMLIALILLFIASAFHLLKKDEWSILWAIMSILSIALLMLSMIINGVSLPKIFKSQLGNPYIRFINYGVAAAVAFLSGMLLIKASIYETEINQQLILDTAKNLFSPAQIFNNTIGLNEFSVLSVSELFLAVLFYVTTATSLLRWKDFVRSEDDVNNIARNLVILGKFTKALDWMSSVPVNYAKISLTKAMALLSINRIDQGLDEIEKATLDEAFKDTDVYSAALLSGIHYCLPSRVNSRLLDKWLNSKPDESLLLVVLQSAQFYFSEETLLQIELDTRIRSRPIHHAMLLLAMNRYSEMEEALEDSAPGSEFEEIIRLVFLLPKGITPESTIQEDHLHIHGWLDSKLPLTESYARELTEKELLVIVIALTTAISFVRSAKVSREDEIMYLRNEFKSRISLINHNALLAAMLNEQEKQYLA